MKIPTVHAIFIIDVEGVRTASTYSSSSTPGELSSSYPVELVTNSLVLGLGLSLLVVLFSAAGLAILRYRGHTYAFWTSEGLVA